MFTTIIGVDALSSLSSTDTLILDCRFSLADTQAGRTAYNIGHIPCAYYLHLDEDLSSPITAHSGRHPLPNMNLFAQRLVSLGLTEHTQVIVYDDCAGAMAARAWWLIKCLGHEAVAVLDGGYPVWEESLIAESVKVVGCYVENVQSQNVAGGLATSKLNHLSDHLAQKSVNVIQLEKLLADSQVCLVDARAVERFRGEIEPIDSVAGHIPSSVNRPLTDNVENGLFKSSECLRMEWLTVLDGVSAKDVVHMCGSGVTACHNLLAMEIAGLLGSKVYAGSWSEWIRDSNRAIMKG